MSDGKALARGSGYSVTSPSTVIRPIRSAFSSVNQSAPSGPAAIPYGPAPAVGTAKEHAFPSVSIRPIRWSRIRVNQSAPSGPTVSTAGPHSGAPRP